MELRDRSVSESDRKYDMTKMETPSYDVKIVERDGLQGGGREECKLF